MNQQDISEEKKYWNEIVNIFYKISGKLFGLGGRGSMLSPLEQQVVRWCADNQVPIFLIRESIEKSLKGHKERYPWAQASPALTYCKPAIRIAFHQYKEARAAGGKPLKPKKTDNGKLERLPKMIELFRSKYENQFYPNGLRARFLEIAEGLSENMRAVSEGIINLEILQEYIAEQWECLLKDIETLAFERHIAEGIQKIERGEFVGEINEYLFQTYSIPDNWL